MPKSDEPRPSVTHMEILAMLALSIRKPCEPCNLTRHISTTNVLYIHPARDFAQSRCMVNSSFSISLFGTKSKRSLIFSASMTYCRLVYEVHMKFIGLYAHRHTALRSKKSETFQTRSFFKISPAAIICRHSNRSTLGRTAFA